ncbi:MAG: endonuclease/exonuclease/phosphatase family protein [Planctomycetota bacterium]
MLTLLCLLATLASTGQERALEPIRAMTFNIRYGTADDGENRWERRRELVIEVIREASPHVLGTQEALDFQIEELKQAFPQYDVFGLGREAENRGEHCAIFVDRERFKVRRHGTFWLSETPLEPGSRSWDSRLPRICSWVELNDRKNGGFLLVLNAHFDHEGAKARVESARLILERLQLWENPPSLVMGDFNAGEGSAPFRIFKEGGFKDTYRLVHAEAQLAGTYHGFAGRDSGDKIDAILCDRRWKVRQASIVRTSKEGRYPSDHFPVTAEVVIAE